MDWDVVHLDLDIKRMVLDKRGAQDRMFRSASQKHKIKEYLQARIFNFFTRKQAKESRYAATLDGFKDIAALTYKLAIQWQPRAVLYFRFKHKN